jgi:hypothetical protein
VNALQTAYAVAEANLTAVRAEVKRLAPMPSLEDDAAFELWLDECAAVEVSLGLSAAEHALAAAEDAMVTWAIRKVAPKANGEAAEAVAFIAARWPKIGLNHRRKMVDIAFRYSGV